MPAECWFSPKREPKMRHLSSAQGRPPNAVRREQLFARASGIRRKEQPKAEVNTAQCTAASRRVRPPAERGHAPAIQSSPRRRPPDARCCLPGVIDKRTVPSSDQGVALAENTVCSPLREVPIAPQMP